MNFKKELFLYYLTFKNRKQIMGKIKTLKDFGGAAEFLTIQFWQALLAEYLGSTFLVLIICGTAINIVPSMHLNISLAAGLIVATIAQVSSSNYFFVASIFL